MAATTTHDNPLIIQSDLTLLVEVNSPRYAEARDALAPFAELVKSPEHIHTYRITPLSIWNACATRPSPTPRSFVIAAGECATTPETHRRKPRRITRTCFRKSARFPFPTSVDITSGTPDFTASPKAG